VDDGLAGRAGRGHAVGASNGVEPLGGRRQRAGLLQSAEADLDATLLPGASGLVRLAAAMAGTVTVTARLLGWSDGDAVVALAAEARGIAVHRLLNQFLGTIRSALAAQGLPPDLVELTAGPDGPRLVVHVQAAVDARASGVVVRDVTLTGGVVRAEVEVVPPVALL
jgi:hypothetical protein